MRLLRCLYKNKEEWGILDKEKINFIEGVPFKKFKIRKQHVPAREVKLLAPAFPTKIVLVGLNYKDHAKELHMAIPKEPIIFLKPPTALLAHKGNIVYPYGVKRLDYEGELALVIKKEAKNISERAVKDYILGYTCLNDVTARDIQKKDGQWTRAKSFDTFCPLGPWLETEFDPGGVTIASYVNGARRQCSSTGNFIFSVPRVVSFISKIMTLNPGDVISTGTPPGVGRLRPLDTVEVEIEGIGRLTNRVTREGARG